MAATLRAHLEALNTWAGQAEGEPTFASKFTLDEETVSFRVKHGSVNGEVSISLFERSGYPRTGGLAFAEGSDELVAAVEGITATLSEDARLDRAPDLHLR